jgi:hypothetical protein
VAERLRVRATLPLIARSYRSTARLILPVALILFVPLGLLEAASDHLGGETEDELTAATLAALVPLTAFQALITTLGDEFYTGVVSAAVTDQRTGGRTSLGRLARELPYLRLFVVDLLYALGTAVGILLLVVPGVIFFTRYALAAPLVEIEHLGVRDAFRRSGGLVRGSFWQVLALLGGLWLVTATLTDLLLRAAGESFLGDWGAAVVVGVGLAPIEALAAVVVAYELVSLKAGARG